MDYLINFDSATSPAELKAAVVDQWGLHPSTVFAGADFELDTYSGPELDVIIQSGVAAASAFDTELQAGIDFAMQCDYASELAVATELCLALGTRAVISAGSLMATRCVLITEDGWNGSVVLDAEELARGVMSVEYALQPVPAVPHLPVRNSPSWDLGWFDHRSLPALEFIPRQRRWDS
ncbi:hypothetical protein [Glycomyces halotolerans]